MDLELSSEQLALQATVRRLLADHAPLAAARAVLASGDAWSPDRAWTELEALGALALLEPGSGSGVVDATVVAEELGRVAYPGPWARAAAAASSRARAASSSGAGNDGDGDGGDLLAVLLGAEALGAADAALECAVAYAKVRQQFGQPIGSFQSVAHLCVDMLETVELVRGSVLHAAWSLDVGDAGAPRSVLRLRASAERLLAVGEAAIQVLGGIGYTWEHDAHLWLRRLLAWVEHARPAAARQDLARLLAG